ncbi:MAG TPA: DUF5682 family protein [Ktedonobacteraceae bacterium]|nr:DUF5682 family protein [Ktedonobacteraceae bacterium]
MSASVSIFGVRHHGPGCARSLRAALEELEPDVVLVEGPPDAQAVLPLLLFEEMQPPVALLIYAPDAPHHAAYYPFTHFSPEWQALRYALTRNIPARFMDLPQAIQLAQLKAAEEQAQKEQEVREILPESRASKGDIPAEHAPVQSLADVVAEETQAPVVVEKTGEDPLDLLAQAAGYDDYELWWERQVEQRHDRMQLFEGILEAMTALRDDFLPKDKREAQREAHMRQTIRAAQREGFQRIAVVCGAWHAPVLSKLDDQKADEALLDGLKRIKVEATWIPWTNSRLALCSGYGAGITSPGWYEHLWSVADRVTIRWLTHAAHLLRAEGLDTSSASVIEAVRLAEALAAMRDLPMPGLYDLREAIQTVLCHGNAEPMQLIRDKLEIGEKLGEVPPETPAVPLQRDLENRQRKLRFKPSPAIETYDFDLRKDSDRQRSQLLHQLRLLHIEWGKPQRSSQKHSTFHELWQVQWNVEFVIKLIEANVWGNTLVSAATAFVRYAGDVADTLPQLTELLDKAILAELPDAIDHLLSCVQSKAAVSADVQHLMDALPPLARVARYGNVRETRAERIFPVIDALFERIIIGLPGACASLDNDAAQSMMSSIDHVQESVSLLNRDDQRREWLSVLRSLVGREGVHGLVRGRCCRLLLEQKAIDEQELQRLARLALSPVNPAAQAAAWIEGVLHGSWLLLLHQDSLWLALDRWLSELSSETFVEMLPLLRRAFSSSEPPERRAMGEKVKRLHSSISHGKTVSGENSLVLENINEERANSVLPVLAHILGVKYDGNR